MRKSLFITVGILFSFNAFSQEKIDIGANFNFAYPTSDHGIGEKNDPTYLPPGIAFGGSLEGNYWFSPSFSAGLEVGYLMFTDEASEASGNTINTSATAIPIMVKATVYFGRGTVKPYFELGAGYSLYTQKQSSTLAAIPIINEWDQSGAILSPRLGLKVDFTDQISFKVNVQYNQMINEIDGDHSVDVSINGETSTETFLGLYSNNVGYLGINAGITFTLFDYFGTF